MREFAAAQMATIAELAAGADPATASVLTDAADTLADIDQQAGCCARLRAGGRARGPGRAVSAGAAAASLENLIARPVAQAQADIDAAEAARITRLRNAAEKSAKSCPPAPAARASRPAPRQFAIR